MMERLADGKEEDLLTPGLKKSAAGKEWDSPGRGKCPRGFQVPDAKGIDGFYEERLATVRKTSLGRGEERDARKERGRAGKLKGRVEREKNKNTVTDR